MENRPINKICRECCFFGGDKRVQNIKEDGKKEDAKVLQCLIKNRDCDEKKIDRCEYFLPRKFFPNYNPKENLELNILAENFKNQRKQERFNKAVVLATIVIALASIATLILTNFNTLSLRILFAILFVILLSLLTKELVYVYLKK
jgi:hypothetical protein